MCTHPESSTPNSAGFTLIETVVAAAVFTLAIIPALYLSNSALSAASNAQDNLIASGLAQEGIEVVRAIRDTNLFGGQAFNANLADGTYRLEWSTTALLPLSNNPPLNVDNGLYTYQSGTPSPFRRTVTIAQLNVDELRVTSTVTWTARSNVAKSVQVEEHLFNWK